MDCFNDFSLFDDIFESITEVNQTNCLDSVCPNATELKLQGETSPSHSFDSGIDQNLVYLNPDSLLMIETTMEDVSLPSSPCHVANSDEEGGDVFVDVDVSATTDDRNICAQETRTSASLHDHTYVKSTAKNTKSLVSSLLGDQSSLSSINEVQSDLKTSLIRKQKLDISEDNCLPSKSKIKNGDTFSFFDENGMGERKQ